MYCMYACVYASIHACVCISAYVTRPAKIGHICTQNLALFLNFNSQYLMTYKSYDNEILKAYSQMNKKAEKVYRTLIS